jgi:hypothetical protein
MAIDIEVKEGNIPHGMGCECSKCRPEKEAAIFQVVMESKKSPYDGEMYVPLTIEYRAEKHGWNYKEWFITYAIYDHYRKMIKMGGVANLQDWERMGTRYE